MKNKLLLLFLPLLAMMFAACDDEISYSEMKEREKDAIKAFIRSEGIKVIKFDDFIKNDSVTDVEENEYVLIDDVYMQIVRNPKEVDGARQMRKGDDLTILVRFSEYNISEGETVLTNDNDSDNPDEMKIKFNGGSYEGRFDKGYMLSIYGQNVPESWLVPLPYIYLTRKDDSQIPKVRLIVPHSKGTSNASQYVYPCFYEITLEPDRNFYDIN